MLHHFFSEAAVKLCVKYRNAMKKEESNWSAESKFHSADTVFDSPRIHLNKQYYYCIEGTGSCARPAPSQFTEI